jgi:hypothetical protein
MPKVANALCPFRQDADAKCGPHGEHENGDNSGRVPALGYGSVVGIEECRHADQAQSTEHGQQPE